MSATIEPRTTLSVGSLLTQSVHFDLSSARITRITPPLTLHPGQNTIQIVGVTPTADAASFRVDARKRASVTSVVARLVPNERSFANAWPLEEDDECEEADSEAVKRSKREVQDLRERLERVRDERAVAATLLEKYSWDTEVEELKSASGERLEDLVARCAGQRAVLRSALSKSGRKAERLDEEMKSAEQRLQSQEKEQERQRERGRDEKRRGAARRREEAAQFWPRMVFSVTITVVPLNTTELDARPVSSATFSSDRTVIANNDPRVELSLSYVVREASWSPRYVVEFDTETQAASITYNAECTNKTSETWKNAVVSFSATETPIGGLKDAVPRLKLLTIPSTSRDEKKAEKEIAKEDQDIPLPLDRHQLFGVDGITQKSPSHSPLQLRPEPEPEAARRRPLFGSSNCSDARHQDTPLSPHFSKADSSSLSSLSSPTASLSVFSLSGRSSMQSQSQINTLFGLDSPTSPLSPPPRRNTSTSTSSSGSGSGSASSASHSGGPVKSPRSPPLGQTSFQTLPYTPSPSPTAAIPPLLKLRHSTPLTIAPSSTPLIEPLFHLAAAPFTTAHIAVPKLRRAAFQRARLVNTSTNVPLLPGTAAVSVDGVYMGQVSLAQVVPPGASFEVPLGVDEGVGIAYPDAVVVDGGVVGGLLSKERLRSSVVTRMLWLGNRRARGAARVRIVEQVPVSGDESVRVAVLVPEGLKREGDIVEAAAAAAWEADLTDVGACGGRTRDDGGSSWGSARCSLRRGGEVVWDVQLNEAKACWLKLEYQVKMPGGKSVALV